MRRVVLTVTVLACVAGMLAGVFHGPLAGTSDNLWPLTWVPWPIAGWIILVRRPGNAIGRVLLAIGAVWGVAFGLQSIVLDVDTSVAEWIEFTYTVLGVAPWLMIVWLLTTFPTGAYAGRREMWLGRAVVAVGVWAMIAFAISPEPMVDTGLVSPLALPSLRALASITSETGFLLVVVLGLLAVVSLIARARRSSGIERQQFRWLLLGGSTFVLVATVGQFVPEGSDVELIWFLGGCAIPVSIGIAVVKYRLYEIDRIVSRTASYIIVLAFLGAVYALGLAAMTSFLPGESSLAVAGSTLAAAALFNPVRKRVQTVVDRRFNRSRFDAEQVIERFAGSLQDRVDSDGLVDGWIGVVNETMQPAAAGVWVRDR